MIDLWRAWRGLPPKKAVWVFCNHCEFQGSPTSYDAHTNNTGHKAFRMITSRP